MERSQRDNSSSNKDPKARSEALMPSNNDTPQNARAIYHVPENAAITHSQRKKRAR